MFAREIQSVSAPMFFLLRLCVCVGERWVGVLVWLVLKDCSLWPEPRTLLFFPFLHTRLGPLESIPPSIARRASPSRIVGWGGVLPPFTHPLARLCTGLSLHQKNLINKSRVFLMRGSTLLVPGCSSLGCPNTFIFHKHCPV